jgi:hypothetical protein
MVNCKNELSLNTNTFQSSNSSLYIWIYVLPDNGPWQQKHVVRKSFTHIQQTFLVKIDSVFYNNNKNKGLRDLTSPSAGACDVNIQPLYHKAICA